jgi:hypothetical protein
MWLTVHLFDTPSAESMGKVLDDLEPGLELLNDRRRTSRWASTMSFQRKAFV